MTHISLDSFNFPDSLTFATNSTQLLQRIVNDPIFAEKIQTAQFSSRRFVQDNGTVINATNELISQIISGGKESKTDPDGVINLQVAIRKLGSSTVGSVMPPSPLITTNITFFENWESEGDTLSLAAHWLHEWLHVAGFRHASRRPNRTDVSYLVGTLVIETGRSFLAFFGRSDAERQGQGYFDAYDLEFSEKK